MENPFYNLSPSLSLSICFPHFDGGKGEKLNQHQFRCKTIQFRFRFNLVWNQDKNLITFFANEVFPLRFTILFRFRGWDMSLWITLGFSILESLSIWSSLFLCFVCGGKGGRQQIIWLFSWGFFGQSDKIQYLQGRKSCIVEKSIRHENLSESTWIVCEIKLYV
jgi:hypothetical protein